MEVARSRRELGFWETVPPEQRWAETRRRIEAGLAEVFRPDRDRVVFNPERLPQPPRQPNGTD
ncbi:hypothetical protein PQI07_26940 [Methylobacterium sp. 092160098-2]|jgi:hypothetical protein|uniref:hypothetical protein n=1 Tax=Methylobacterium sp. 092160098-2 TaxID=3025129 RepID=UPI0023819CCF|nr:hypothetical protein [Methylobacterium sp. 092160098-2]MDE4914310.1 hypothetical protein [Methylobacterium sp. 092160098-2]